MRDGRFKTLEEVIDHYRNDIKVSATLDPVLGGGISISDAEKIRIVAFIKTLTDREFIRDHRFSQPIINP